MPRLDGTGPNGQGALTGRKLGNCQNQEAPQNTRPGRGMGCGNGRRAGRGCCGGGKGRGFGRCNG